MRPKHASVWTLISRSYTTEHVQSILQPEISNRHFEHFPYGCKVLKSFQEKKKQKKKKTFFTGFVVVVVVVVFFLFFFS